MSDIRELPDHVREFVDMSKEYLRQETLEPAKQLGRFAGLSLAAGLSFALGALLIGIAVMRYVRMALPEGEGWSALAYLISVVIFGIVVAILFKMTSRSTSKEK